MKKEYTIYFKISLKYRRDFFVPIYENIRVIIWGLNKYIFINK